MTENLPDNLCGYQVQHWLKPARTALCQAGGQRLLVLKELGQDCLLSGTLHPSVQERLAKVRELPHGQIAAFLGVEKDPSTGAAYTLWEYVDAANLETALAADTCSLRHTLQLLRELTLIVEALHGQGIIHGELHGGNILLTPRGEIRLTDISPLLFTEPQRDLASLNQLIVRTLQQRRELDTPAGKMLLRHIATGSSLRDLAAALIRAMDYGLGPVPASNSNDQTAIHFRRRAVLLAFADIFLAAAATLLGWWFFTIKMNPTYQPPQAPPQAMQPRNP